MSTSNRTSLRATVMLAFILIFILAGILYLTTGRDYLGIFTPTEIPLPPTSTGTPAPPAAVSAAAPWWEVYFTDPLTVNNPDNYHASIEQALIDRISAAQASIHIAAFEFDLTPVAEALISAHRRGVDVRWITDDEFGLLAESDPDGGQFSMLVEAGIQIRSDDRTALMHNKFWIFDASVVWTGSTNITLNGIFEQNNNVIVLHSPEVAAMYEREFQEMWDGQYGPRSPSTLDRQSTLVDGTPVHVLFSAEDGIIDRLIAFVQGAQTRIRFLAFSFTDYPLADAMRQRAAAGVDVAGVFETVGSGTEAAELDTLLCAGIPVRQDGNSGFMHHKLIILDDHIVITGSLNFSSSADEENDENVLIIDNPEIARVYLAEFERLYSQAADPDPVKFPCP